MIGFFIKRLSTGFLNIAYFFCFFSFAFICVIFCVRRNFVLIGTNPIAQILFHCIVQIDGADSTFIKGIIKHCIIIPMIGSLIVALFVYGNFPFLRKDSQSRHILIYQEIWCSDFGSLYAVFNAFNWIRIKSC